MSPINHSVIARPEGSKQSLLNLAQAKEQMARWIKTYKPSKSIQRLEIKIKPVDMLAWLAGQKAAVKIYGANQSDTTAIAGIGTAIEVKGATADYKKVFQQLRACLSAQFPYLQWYGGFCFDQRKKGAAWNGFGAYRFVVPRFELATNEGKMIFCCNLVGSKNIPTILKQLHDIGIPAKTGALKSKFLMASYCRKDLPGLQSWQTQISRILSDKALQKAVLARKTVLTFKRPLDPWAMLRSLKAVTPNSYHFAFQFGPTVFLGASPERLYRRYQRFLESEALAGTMPKSIRPEQLKNSVKNQHEHALVVQALEQAFEKFCRQYQRDRQAGILTLANGHHLITKFHGQLKDGVTDEDILQSLHPTPALGGVPKDRAIKVIRRLESFSRGWYAGPVGYVGLDWAEFVVAIRSGLVRGRNLSVFAGAGIVQGSQPQDEWDEVENKISNFIKIIQ